MNPNIVLLEAAVRLLEPLLDRLVFAGGCVTGLFMTDAASGGIRPTDDIDVIVEVGSYAGYITLSERLRELGLKEDMREGAPRCRWLHHDLVLDVMPTDDAIFGFAGRWFRAAMETADHREIAGRRVRVISPACFLATKLEAFRSRGNDDYSASHDLEDVIAVIDGRPDVLTELKESSTDLRRYVASEFRSLLRTRAFMDALPGFLLPDPGSQARLPGLTDKLSALANLEQRK